MTKHQWVRLSMKQVDEVARGMGLYLRRVEGQRWAHRYEVWESSPGMLSDRRLTLAMTIGQAYAFIQGRSRPLVVTLPEPVRWWEEPL